jgi:toxin-antitoxin system PIN domain toxin
MILCDVNVLVYAHREDALDHARYRGFVASLLNGPAAFGVSDLVLSGFLRVATHPRIFSPPSPSAKALAFAAQIRRHSNATIITPGPAHWDLFLNLCRKTSATGNAIPDAYFAALAIESHCEWVTTDHGFARFPGLRWRHPLD